MLLLFTLNIFRIFFWYFSCWLWTSKCLLGCSLNTMGLSVSIHYNQMHLFSSDLVLNFYSDIYPFSFLFSDQIIFLLEQKSCENDWDITWVINIMHEIGIQFSNLFQQYDNLFKTKVSLVSGSRQNQVSSKSQKRPFADILWNRCS